MAWHIAWLFAGAFLANAVPHIAQGICGHSFPTPFASPPGRGNSSPEVNVFWGFFNLAVGGALLYAFLPQLPPPGLLCVTALLGGLLMALYLARHFAKVRGTEPQR